AECGTDRFLADRREAMLAHRRAQALEALARGHARLEPGRLGLSPRLLPVSARLDAVLDRREALLGLVLRARDDDRNAAKLAHRDLLTSVGTPASIAWCDRGVLWA